MTNIAVATGIPASLLAHQGGWDEILLVAAPMALIAGLLWLAKRRVRSSQPPPSSPAPPSRSPRSSPRSAPGSRAGD